MKDIFLRYYEECKRNSIPCLSLESWEIIHTKLHEARPKTVLEIGTARGLGCSLIADTINERGGQVYTFERSFREYQISLRWFRKGEFYNIHSYYGDFLQTPLETIITKIDFAFVDAQKTQYLDYYRKIVENVDGIIIFDDVVRFKEKVQNLYDYFEREKIQYELIESEPGDGVLILS